MLESSRNLTELGTSWKIIALSFVVTPPTNYFVVFLQSHCELVSTHHLLQDSRYRSVADLTFTIVPPAAWRAVVCNSAAEFSTSADLAEHDPTRSVCDLILIILPPALRGSIGLSESARMKSTTGQRRAIKLSGRASPNKQNTDPEGVPHFWHSAPC
jgi:hypothetical protein